jgi:hypothetical protein
LSWTHHVFLCRRSSQTGDIRVFFLTWFLHSLRENLYRARVTRLKSWLFFVEIIWSWLSDVIVGLCLFSEDLWWFHRIKSKLVTNSLWLLSWLLSCTFFTWFVKNWVLLNLETILSFLNVIVIVVNWC